MHKKQWLIVLVGLVLLVALIGFLNRQRLLAFFFSPTQSSIQPETNGSKQVETVASDLETPWSISFMPAGDMLVTERSGQMRRLGETGKIYTIDGVEETSEGGLLGIALHPEFAVNNQLYLYSTTKSGETLTNKIDRYVLKNDQLTYQRSILKDIPAASNHNGGAIAFGPDKKLYVTTGDAAQENLAQDTASLAGKILRLNDDGTEPGDNPFGNLTWSYGHRNPQGIAWDDEGRLWSVEHGPSGAQTGRDELNLIERGANYGWPAITGDQTRDGMKAPVVQSGVNETWAPAGMAYYDGVLYFAGLRGQSLYKATVKGETVSLTKLYSNDYGRLRAVTVRENTLYFSTSNRDGRGSPKSADDKVLRVEL